MEILVNHNAGSNGISFRVMLVRVKGTGGWLEAK
jgi:hypothetical protein